MNPDKPVRSAQPRPAPEPDSPKPQEPKRPVEFPPEQRPGVPADAPPVQAKNEGEGNRTADRQYRKGATAFAKSGRVEPAAKAAAKAVEGPEGRSLRDAEARAKSRR